ncbi:MAG: hypothetical protein HY985_13995 [Magnetospirillum sp.]|nr:hypothetical protein [Magnetospirillum sp.]
MRWARRRARRADPRPAAAAHHLGIHPTTLMRALKRG